MKYVVSDLSIDTGSQSVTRAGVSIALPKRSFDLFLVLIRAAPNLVSLDELMRQVWEGTVVSPETVSKRVMLLREALDEDLRAPRYIAGLRGRGYRIIASVSEVTHTNGGSSPDIESPSFGIEDVIDVEQPARGPLLPIEKLRRSSVVFLASAGFILGAVGFWQIWAQARASVGHIDVMPNAFAGTWVGTLETCSPSTTYSGPFSIAISNTDLGLLHLVYYGYGPDGAINLTGSYDLKEIANTATSVTPPGITYNLKNEQLFVSYPELCQHGTLHRQSLKPGP